MDGKQFRTGSIAVLFVVIMLCVAVLSVLTVSTAASDRRTAQRYGEYVQRLNECQNAGQQWLAEADAYINGLGALPDNTASDGGELSTVIENGAMTLKIRLAVRGSSCEIMEWDCQNDWQPEEEQWHLWQK